MSEGTAVTETPRGKVGFGVPVPGMSTRPVAHEVRKKTLELNAKTPERLVEYHALSRVIRIVNRAEKGPLKGRPFLGVFDGQLYPDEVDPNDPETHLQPGEYMDVPKDAALHLLGNLWDQGLPSKQDIISRYGGMQFAPPAGGHVSGRTAPMIARAMPPLPDLLACEVNARGKTTSDWKSLYELYTAGLRLPEDLFEDE